MPEMDKGYLLVSTRTADGVLLIPYANVRVYDEEGNLLAEEQTNQDGYTSEIVLSAPPPSNSLSPGQENPYRVVTIKVDKEGFYPMEYRNAPIFPNIVTIQQTNLQPIPKNGTRSPNAAGEQDRTPPTFPPFVIDESGEKTL